MITYTKTTQDKAKKEKPLQAVSMTVKAVTIDKGQAVKVTTPKGKGEGITEGDFINRLSQHIGTVYGSKIRVKIAWARTGNNPDKAGKVKVAKIDNTTEGGQVVNLSPLCLQADILASAAITCAALLKDKTTSALLPKSIEFLQSFAGQFVTNERLTFTKSIPEARTEYACKCGQKHTIKTSLAKDIRNGAEYHCFKCGDLFKIEKTAEEKAADMKAAADMEAAAAVLELAS